MLIAAHFDRSATPSVAEEVNLFQESSARLSFGTSPLHGRDLLVLGQLKCPRKAARQLFKKPPQHTLLLAAELPANLEK